MNFNFSITTLFNWTIVTPKPNAICRPHSEPMPTSPQKKPPEPTSDLLAPPASPSKSPKKKAKNRKNGKVEKDAEDITILAIGLFVVNFP